MSDFRRGRIDRGVLAFPASAEPAAAPAPAAPADSYQAASRKLVEVRENMTDLETTLLRQSEKVRSLAEQNDSYRAALGEIKDAARTREHALINRFRSLEKIAVQWRGRAQELARRNEGLRTSFEQMRARLADLEQQRKDRDLMGSEELKAAKNEAEELRYRLSQQTQAATKEATVRALAEREIKKLRSELEEHRQRLGSLEKERSAWSEREAATLAVADTDSKRYAATLQERSAKIFELETKLGALSMREQQFRAQHEPELKRLREAIDRDLATRTSLEAETRALRESLQEKSVLLARFETELAQVAERDRVIDSGREEALRRLQGDLAAARARADRIENQAKADLQRESQARGKAEHEAHDLRSALQDRIARQSALENEVVRADSRVEREASARAKADSEARELRDAITEKNLAFAKLEAELARAQEREQLLGSSRDGQQKRIEEELASMRFRAERAEEDARAAAVEHQERERATMARLQSLEADLRTRVAAETEATSVVAALRAELTEAAAQYETLRSQAEAEFIRRTEAAREAAAEADRRIRESNRRIQDLEASTLDERARADGLESRLRRRNDEVTQLQRQVTELEEELRLGLNAKPAPTSARTAALRSELEAEAGSLTDLGELPPSGAFSRATIALRQTLAGGGDAPPAAGSLKESHTEPTP